MRARMQHNICFPLEEFVKISFPGYYVLELKYIPGTYYVNTYQDKKKTVLCYFRDNIKVGRLSHQSEID